MSYKLIKLTLKSSQFMTVNYQEELTGFLLQYNSVIYILSVHHNLPIETIYEKQYRSDCNVLINSCWSESIILDSKNIDTTQFTIFKKIQNRIQLNDANIFTIIDNERCEVDILGFDFQPFDGFNQSPETPYIIGKLKIQKETIAGNSGAPVFIRDGNDDILIGVIAKYQNSNNNIYIIPIYVFIKNFEKKDNINIYGIDCINCSNINKIGSYNVTEDLEHGKVIYHPTLKINIPISTYFLLEGDLDVVFSVNYSVFSEGKNTNIINNVSAISINNNLIVSHEESLLFKQSGRFKVNLRLLSLLKRITNVEMQKRIFTKVQNNLNSTKSNDFWLDLKSKA